MAAGDHQHGAGKRDDAAGDVVPAELFARQQGREHDDQQRPEIVDEAGFDGRRVAQGDEVGGVVAEQAADAEQPDRPGLPQRFDGAGRKASSAMPASPPMPKVMARSWNGGMAPLAAVSTASEAQSRTAQKPMPVAARRERVMTRLLAGFVMAGEIADCGHRVLNWRHEL